MSQIKDAVETCTEPGCEKPAGPPRMAKPICWAHYKRAKRGSSVDGQVRDYKTGQELVTCPPLAPKVLRLLAKASKANTPNRDADPSLYEAERRVLKEWLGRYELRRGKPDAFAKAFLAGPRALNAPVDSDEGYKTSSKIAVLPDEVKLFNHAVAASGLTGYALLVTIFDDWFYFWTEAKDDDAVPGTTISPFGPPPIKAPRRRRG